MLSRQGKKPQRPGFLSLVKQSLRKDIIHGPLFLLQEKKIEQWEFKEKSFLVIRTRYIQPSLLCYHLLQREGEKRE